jgi:hypothetical protein
METGVYVQYLNCRPYLVIQVGIYLLCQEEDAIAID